MATLIQLETWLNDAETARHALAMGERVVEVVRNGRKMTFAKADSGDLDRYIEKLKVDIEAANAAAAGLSRRRPISLAWKN